MLSPLLETAGPRRRPRPHQRPRRSAWPQPGTIAIRWAARSAHVRTGRPRMPVVYHRDRPWILSASGHPSLSMVVNREVGTSALSVWLANHEPGEDVPLHLHDVEEVLTFIEGEAEATLGSDTFPVRAGMSIIVPPGTPHGYRNTGSGPLRIVASIADPDAQRGRLAEPLAVAGA